MLRFWRRRFLAPALVTGLLIAGCGSVKTPLNPTPNSPAPSPAAPAAQPLANAAQPQSQALTKVKLAPGPWGTVLWMSQLVGEGIGSFKEQGIDLEVLKTDGGNDATKALLGKEADFAMVAMDHSFKNRVQNADLVVVSALSRYPGLVFIVHSDLQGQVKSMKDLKGKRVGVSSLGGGTHQASLALMSQDKMNEGEIEFIGAKDKLAEMWDEKKIVAAMHVDPQTTELVEAGKAWILYDYRKAKDTLALYGTEYPLGSLVTRQDVIDQKPELVESMIRGFLSANRFIAANADKPEKIADSIPEIYRKGINAKVYVSMVKENIEQLAMDGRISPAAIDTVVAQLVRNKAIPDKAKLDMSKAVNWSFLDRAQVAKK